MVGSKLAGKTALITGAARGQGYCEAKLFASEGARVFMTDVGEPEGSLPPNCRFMIHDVTSEADWEGVIAAILADGGELDVLVNNAGVFKQGDMETETVEGWDLIMDVNVKGTFLGMKHGARAMRSLNTPERDRSIINISSVAGLMGTGGAIAYGASKWAVRGMTKSGASDLGVHGIRCNSVHPGLISTRMLHDTDGTGVGIPEGAAPPSVPLGRLAEAIEVAKLVLFLASDDASYCSGGEFTVDGGMTASQSVTARTPAPADAPVAVEPTTLSTAKL